MRNARSAVLARTGRRTADSNHYGRRGTSAYRGSGRPNDLVTRLRLEPACQTSHPCRKEANGGCLSSKSNRSSSNVRERTIEERDSLNETCPMPHWSAALVAVLLVVGFLAWAILGGRTTPVEPDPGTSTWRRDHHDFRPRLSDETDDSWWSVDLVLAVHNASSRIPFIASNVECDCVAESRPSREFVR